MRRSREENITAHHHREADALFDALGLSGDNTVSDSANTAIALHSFMLDEHDTQETVLAKEKWIQGIYAMMNEPGASRDSVTVSTVLGYAVAYKIADTPDRFHKKDEACALIDRCRQTISITQQAQGHGDYKAFISALRSAWAEVAESSTKDEQRWLSSLVDYAAWRGREADLSRPIQHEQLSSPGFWRGVLAGLGTIAMVHGATIVPPRQQTDENGAWDPELNSDEIEPDDE